MKKRIWIRVWMMLLVCAMLTGTLLLETPAKQSISVNSVLGNGEMHYGMQVPIFSERTSDEDVQVVTEVKEDTTDVQTVTEEEETFPTVSELDLSSLDWKKASDEEINHYLGMLDWSIIGQWLDSLTEEELEELLARDTLLAKDTTIEEPDAEPVQMLYYEYALNQYYSMMRLRSSYPARASGYWTTNIVQTNAAGTPVKKAVITFKISGIDTSLSTTERQKVTVAKTMTGNWCDIVWSSDEDSFKTYRASESVNYSLVKANFCYSKPAGYTVGVSYSLPKSFHKLYWNKSMTFNAEPMLENDGLVSTERYAYPEKSTCNGISTASLLASEYAGKHHLSGLVNMYVNAGVGTVATETEGNLVQTVTLSPINYNVSYDGNGYTGGSVSSQNCTYDVNYTAQPNGYQREYTVTYNGNGGTPQVSSQKVSYLFKGWGLNQKNTVTYKAGSIYKNLTGVSGGKATMYALWSPASVKLPSAARTGYRFTGWNIGDAGTTYTPVSNMTAIAKWEPNKYTIKFLSSGGSACEDIAATYDSNVQLPTPERAGYAFKGWKGISGTYMGRVKNLTAEDGGLVTLVAEWEALTNTPYTIRCYKQPSKEIKDKKKYVLFQLKDGDSMDGEYVQYGMTDTTVTVSPVSVEGYETPEAQTIQISGDGKTVVNFYYDLKDNAESPPTFSATEDRWDEIAKKIAAGLSFSLDIDGAEYEIAQTDDGTFGIKFISADSEKVVIPDVIKINEKVYRITEIQSGAFRGNQMIKEVQLSANISKIGTSAFEGCTSLKKVVLREGLVTIGAKAFSGCILLKSVKLPSTVQSIGSYAFQNCTSLSKLTMNEGLLKIGNKAFFGCSSLTKISIPKTVLQIGTYAFSKCKKIRTVSFVSGSKLLSAGKGVFAECSSLKKIKLPSKLTSVSTKAFYKCTKLKSVTIGKSVTKIGVSAFAGCKKITKVTIPSKVQTIGKKAFYKCTLLKKITIKTKALTSVGSKAFKGCKKGIYFVVPKEKKSAYSKLFRGKY